MKRKLLVGLAIGFLLFGLAGAASATVIDFDTSPVGPLAPDTVLNEQYASLGVHFSAWEDGSEVNSVVSNTYDLHDGNWWGNTTSGSFGPRHDILRVTFDNEAANVQWYVQSHGSAQIIFQAYDSADNLLEQFSHASGYPVFDLVGFSASGISRVDMLQPNDNWGWVLDDLSFNMDSEPVPEPSTILLLGFGFVGLAGLARKKIKK